MGKKAKGKHRLDKFYHLAKEQGFRSRAAFKLIQLNRKYDFLSKSRATLDLCAAPGGWLQVAAKYMPVSSLIIGVDLDPIRPIRGVKTFIGDITTQKTRAQLRKEANGSPMDCVLHDGAPNVGGAWSSEAFTQSALVLEALKLATEFLAPNGTFVTKIFRSKDYTSLLFAFNQLFNKVEATKPAASRATSAEIFVVCLGYKAPAKIDPRLLDPRHLFQEVTEIAPNAGPDALIKHKVKKQRHREGYAEGISTTHKAISAAAFVLSNHPIEVLGNHTRLVLEGPGSLEGPPIDGDADTPSKAGPPITEQQAAFIAQHVTTNAEIRTLCGDLQVLGRSEFKQLLKWRLKLHKEMDAATKAAAKNKTGGTAAGGEGDKMGEGDKEGEEEEEELDPEEKVLMEMAELKEKMDTQRKKDRRRRHELKLKARVRAAQLAQAEGIADAGTEEGLFSLVNIKGSNTAAHLQSAGAPSAEELDLLEASSTENDTEEEGVEEDSDADSEERMRRYDDALDEGFEESYQSYLVRQKLRKAAAADAAARKRKRVGMAGELEEGGSDGEGVGKGLDAEGVLAQPVEEEEEQGGGLLVQLPGSAGRPKTPAAQAVQWFSQGLFQDPELLNLQEAPPKRARVRPTPVEKEDSSMEDSSDVSSAEEEEEEEEERDAKTRRTSTKPTTTSTKGVTHLNDDSSRSQGHESDVEMQDDEFEVVPEAPDLKAGGVQSSDSEDEFEALDDAAKVEIRALAKRMLRGKERWSIIEAAYNKRAFHDEGLPRWFEEDEYKHMRPIIELTKQEIDDAKEALKAVDARPIKKVAEAKARKRKRLEVKLAAARQKAEAIAGQDDVPASSKLREIEKVMAKARATGKGRKGGKAGRGAKRKGPRLDPRMRADKRQVNSKAKAAAAKKAKRKSAKAKALKGGRA